MQTHISFFERYWMFLLALIMVLQSVGGIDFPSIIYIISLIMSAVAFTFKGKVFCNRTLIILIVICLLSILVGQPDPRFKSYQRFFYFVILLCVVSPMFYSEKLSVLRHVLLYDVLHLFTILSVGSFFCYFLGINLMRDLEYLTTGGHFGGLFRHSMLLGPISAVSCVYILTSEEWLFSKKWLRILLFVFCLGSLFFAASRGAFVAGVIAIIFVLYNKSPNKVRFIKIMLGISIVLLLTFPLWKFALNGITYKIEDRGDTSWVSSRESRFDNRLEEFSSNPITGVGFCSAKSYYLPEVASSGTVEYGSSWLCILATTGLSGFIVVLVLLFSQFKNVYRFRYQQQEAVMLASLLLCFFIHFLIEGYIFSAGSPLCFVFWLIVGNSNSQYYDKKYTNIITD